MYCLQYEDEEEEEEDAAGQAARLKERQRLEQDDQLFPDEVRAVHAVLTLCSCCAGTCMPTLTPAWRQRWHQVWC